ncbi:Long-chain-fatty-acid--CoA ligase 6 [Entomophthora muscae]|uniref:Long-chain-fatty-acid--CoA ligase 6 n=1 Tax=Entomophthora muscae TaxID=34485 RepID=A0ACC2T9P6_9FUNG|nr:Long-chain-fatty-acid--CoA ligase 6 [Entomophthora muscae]
MVAMHSPKIVGLEVPNTKKDNQTGVITGYLFQEKFLTPNSDFPQTVYESFLQGCKVGPETPLFGKRKLDPKTNKPGPYVWETYDQVKTRVQNFSSGIEYLRKQHSLNEKCVAMACRHLLY